jgi:hypothetical protein
MSCSPGFGVVLRPWQDQRIDEKQSHDLQILIFSHQSL